MAVDGKTQRGVTGQKERLLLAVSHQGRQIVAQKPLTGPKKSEITAVRELLAETALEKGQTTLDALHFNPTTLRQVEAAYAQHPERFVGGLPQPASVPTAVWINKPQQPEKEPCMPAVAH